MEKQKTQKTAAAKIRPVGAIDGVDQLLSEKLRWIEPSKS